ncbi:MAG TPA: amidohydrolase family protein [Gaiellaceae bacterium]|nr:amidohydrolase family protein [Gaiellaceae bacterium]
MLAAMDAAGIERAIACPVKPYDYDLRAANEIVAEAVAATGGRLTGVARVDPLRGDAARRDLAYALDELGLRGLFLHPWEETYRIADRVVDRVVEPAGERGLPVIVAAGYPLLSEALQVSALARRFPEVTFIATNGLQLNISGLGQIDAELALAEADNLLLQTAGVYREDFLEGVVRRFGAERMLFASSYPLLDPRLEIKRVEWASFADADRVLLLGANAERVFRT